MLRKVLFILASLLLSNIVVASDSLSADEIKALVTNKTFDVHNVIKDKNLQVHDDDSGGHYVYIPWKDKVSNRKWWIEDNKHCTSHPKRGDNCKVLINKGDGTYHGISDGEHTHTLSNFRDGKSFNK